MCAKFEISLEIQEKISKSVISMERGRLFQNLLILRYFLRVIP